MIRNRELKREISALNHRLEMIQTVLLVSNPDSPMAADAYNGLRRTVVQSLQATQVLQAGIAQLDSIAAATDDIEIIRAKLGELMTLYGVTKIEQYDVRPDAFERIGQGSTYTVTKSAYVASPDMPAIQMGVAEALDESPPTPEADEQPAGIDLITGPESSETDLTQADSLPLGDAE